MRPTLEVRKPQILLIDDCIAQRDLYELALESDFAVVTATTGADGLSIAGRTSVDAIVLDLMMPGMDGWETRARLKADPATADIPVVLLTGLVDPDLSEHARAVGAARVLRKPCAAERLRAVLFAAIGGVLNS